MKKTISCLSILLILSLCCVIALADTGSMENATPAQDAILNPLSDPEAYLAALEKAMDARYGGRDQWPKGFETFLALSRYASGVTAPYEGDITWAPDAVQQLETKALQNPEDYNIVLDYLLALQDALAPKDRIGHSWPYEAKALIYSTFYYMDHPLDYGNMILPTDGAIPEAEAIALGKAAITEACDLLEGELDAYEVYTGFFPDYGGTPIWSVIIGLNDMGYELYYAYLEADTGHTIVAALNEGNG